MFDSVILGLVQGATEFLPISSSGHLVLAQTIFGFREIDPAFNVFVQGGTVLSVLVYFRRQLLRLDWAMITNLILATVPAAVVGYFLSDYIDTIFTSLWGVALGFLLTTILVWTTKFLKEGTETVNRARAIRIGLAQAFAVLPGLTRSGTTITAALFQKVESSSAFQFSFLMSIPIVSGASILGAGNMSWDQGMTASYWTGFAVAAISGYFSLILLAKMMKQGKFYVFAPYTLVLACISVLLATRY